MKSKLNMVRMRGLLLSAVAAISGLGPGLAYAADPADTGEAVNPVTRVEDPGTATMLTWSVIAPPLHPVKGSDGLMHLAYEVQFANVVSFATTVKIESVEVIDAADNSVVKSVKTTAVDGTDITYKVRNYDVPATMEGKNYSDKLGPGQFGVMYMNVMFENEDDMPRFLGHRVTVSIPEKPDFKPITATGGYVEIDTGKAVVLTPPLKGDGWVDANGCCEILSPHRFAFNDVDGKLRLAERFAIDFVKLDDEGKLYEGDPTVLENWHYFGTEVYSAAPGKVVKVMDGLPNQALGQLPANLTLETAGGNQVVVDIGGGKYAFYAHMIPGSIKVKEGDFVEGGQVIGRLGNSGNSDAPHLHFHVMDNKAALNSNGLPYVFKNWNYQGRLSGANLGDIADEIQGGKKAVIDTAGAGPRQEALPLTNDVIGFD